MNKNQLNDIVFEALFQQAIIDELEEEINSIQPEELNDMCIPSPEFKLRMKKLFEKDNKKTFIRSLSTYTKKAAVIIFVFLGCLFTTLLLNKEVQATVNKIIIEIYEKFNSIIFNVEQSSFEEKEWILNYIPQGYNLKSQEKLGDYVNIEYEDMQGNIIEFIYSLEINGTNISVDNENHEMKEIKILNENAYLFIAQNSKFDNGIIWSFDGYSFRLWGKNSVDELKKMAESVSKK